MRKAQRSKKAQVSQLAEALILNGAAMKNDPLKPLTVHDLRKVLPLTANQNVALGYFDRVDHMVLNGSAGTGKSFLALHQALKSVLVEKKQDRIVIVRSAVEIRKQGFLPGDMKEKNAPYEAPYKSIFHELLGKATAYEHMKKAGQVSFETTGYLRGLTMHDSVVVFDEIQNASWEEINTVMTRLGDNSRVIVCGDTRQTDLKNGESGYPKALRVWENMEDFAVVTFGHDDIVRSKVVKDWIVGSEKLR